MEDELHCAVRH